ncbi:[cytidine(C)-cytidine(C)-adenosine (A)]-adding enzyme [Exiguobacterium sp. KRL4]|uniref:CCA tRNA nucleotidyltransferase n=1 Tax=Exiguobacterium sp. KRL4 TaxID=1914536 RepID=UPI0008F82CAB|nr:CCA tRNA nucleotidyltransferase [Exiguobacterium sp. KRL4]OIN67984.1 [cytidine(C)-cytidine(C)-adenosine (A)]-adding enzyme [Exiguobacterium sp. KRL4]
MKMLERANQIIQTIEQAGGEAYIVGGAVRDMLLKRQPGDYDLATSLFPHEVIPLFPVVIPTGLDHGTVTVVLDHDPFEVTTFRSESTYSDRRRPDEVTLGVSLEEDLTRRDFTINAMALKPTGLVDLFGGQDDLAAKIVRTVGRAEERFDEDALRMIRAFRFMSQLEFSLDPQTEQAIEDKKEHLQAVAVERIANEFEKLLLGPGRTAALEAMLRTGVYAHLPHLDRSIIEHLIRLPFNGVSTDDVWTLVLVAGLRPEALRAWKRSKKQEGRAKTLAVLVNADTLSDWQRYRLSDEELLHLNEMTGRHHDKRTTLPIRELKDLTVNGRDMIELGLHKKEIKEALRHLEKQVVYRHLENQRDSLLREVMTWKKQHGTGSSKP